MDREEYGTREQQTEALEKFAAGLDTFLRERFDYRSELTHARLPTINVKRTKVELYLRLCHRPQGPNGFWPQWTLVIARMEFRERRAGHGRALLQFLVQQAERFGYDKIGVEQTIPHEDIQGFCRHFFKQYRPDDSSRPDSNWIAPVNDVAQQLASDRATTIATHEVR